MHLLFMVNIYLKQIITDTPPTETSLIALHILLMYTFINFTPRFLTHNLDADNFTLAS